MQDKDDNGVSPSMAKQLPAAGDAESQIKLGALTGLRFFAALAVALYHVPYVLPLSANIFILPDGALGVSFFFILSGFILSHVYRGRRIDVVRFYRRRFARIYPLHLLTALVWILLYFRSWGNPLPEKLNSAVANLLLVHAFFSGPLFNLGLNAVSWSISVEAFFYVVFPYLTKYKLPLVVAVLCFVFAVALPHDDYSVIQAGFPNFFYFNPLGRLLEFSVGIVCYSIFVRIRCPEWLAGVLQIAAVILLVVSVRAFDGVAENYRDAILIWPFGAVIICFSLRGIASRLVGSRLFIILGESSFAFYMIHHMLFRLVDAPVAALKLGPTGSIALAICVVQIIALAVHYGFERPARSVFARG